MTGVQTCALPILSIPKDGSAGSYMVAEGGTFLWKDLGGETYRTYRVK